MIIDYIEIKNFRNLGGCKIHFHPKCNYIIGENNIGKSNLLFLLDAVINGRYLSEDDYFDSGLPIEVIIHIRLLEEEQGFFGDVFSPEDSSLVKLRVTFDPNTLFPTYVSDDSGETLSPKALRKLHFVRYNSTANPDKELRPDSNKGVGLLVNHLIEKYTSKNDVSTLLNPEIISGVEVYLNEYLKKIQGFKKYSISATASSTAVEKISRLFHLSDGTRSIELTGSGVQYMTMATVNVLSQILQIYNSKTIMFEDQLFSDESGKKYYPIILSIDEPEVHLHPYLQRSLINYYKRILENKDRDFLELLHDCFDIDGLSGQLLIVTHSTDALIDDYRNLIRFYRENDITNVVCGSKLTLRNDKEEKHLLMHFPEIKEAFYAKCAILVEGETEYGCIHSFARKLDISLDDHSICVLNAQGEGTIQPTQQLLSKFGIKSVVIYDGDVRQGQTPEPTKFFTNELCFEIEIVKNLYDLNKQDVIKQIVRERDSNGENELLGADYLRKPFEKIGRDITSYTPKRLSEVSDSDREEFCDMYSSWYMKKKGILLGRIVGEILTREQIPVCYADAIRKAREITENA